MPQPLLAQVAYRTFQAQHRPLQARPPQNASLQSTQKDIKNGMTTQRFLGWKYAATAGKDYQALFHRPRAGMARPRMEARITGALASRVNGSSTSQVGTQTFPGLAFRDSLPSGFIPTGVATGDFNRDGNADWVVSNAGDNDLWVYLGNGDGTASTPTILNLLGLGPLAVATGDLRGNGKIDIVVAEADSGTIEVFLGNGDGTFAPGGVYPLNGMPTFVVLADFNRDGKLDVAVSEFGQSPIAFLAGNGDGTLSAPVYDSWGQGLPQLVTIQAIDLDNDGALDLVYFDIEGAGVVGVALGHGDGTFSPGTIVAGNPFVQSFAVAAGDVDEDGCADIVLVNIYSLAEVYKGNCDGTFSPVPNQFETGAIGVSVALRDMDGDGHLDIVAASDYFPLVSADDAGSLLSVLKGDGHGRFAPATVFRGDPGMYSFAFLNLRGSSLPSIVAASQDLDRVTVFKNDGTADFGQPSGRSIGYNGGTVNSPFGDFKIADLNQDNRPDLLALELPQYSPGNYEIVTVLNQGNGKFSAPIHSIFFPDSLTSSGPGDYALGDFRNTGHLDAVAVGALGGGSLATPFLAFSAGNSDATFAPPTIVTPPTAEGLIGVGDFNRDGKLDFVTLNFTYPQQTLNVFLGNGDGTFRPEPPIVYGGSEERWPVSVYVADFNGDGKLDVLVYLFLNVVPPAINDVYLFYGNGDGTFQQPVKLYSNLDPFTLVDVNHDGIPDIVTCRFDLSDYPSLLTPVSTSVMLGTGRGGFGPPTTYQTYPGYSRLPTTTGTDWGGQGYCTVGDFNGDGNIDIGVMQWDGFIRFGHTSNS
jgi:FG-GAP-like repeat